MLSMTFLHQPQDRKYHIDNFDGKTATWIVSDLKQKFEIQQKILSEQGFFEDHSVLRASEFWKILARRKFPKIEWVSSEWIHTWVKNEIAADPELNLNQRAFKTVAEFMNIFAGVNLHSLGGQRMREWFAENPNSLQRWGGWFLLSEKLTQDLLNRNQASHYWTQALLQNETIWENYWDRKIIFDLGAQASMLESELIKSLSKFLEVEVLVPAPKFSAEFDYLLKPYQDLMATANLKSPVTSSAHPDKSGENLTDLDRKKKVKHSGILAEVKSAVHLIRCWLEQGIEPDKIILVAPDIEKYWPMLAPLLKAEGVAVNKSVVSRLQSLPAVSAWLSCLKVSAGLVSFNDLEVAAFLNQRPLLRYEEFYSLFNALIDGKDLKRHSEIEKAFHSSFDADQLLSQNEFVGFAVKAWRDTKFNFLEQCLREIFSVSTKKDQLRLRDWIFFIEQVIAKKETNIESAIHGGIHLNNIPAAEALNQTHKIYLGLCESMLRERTQKVISGQEVNSIAKDLGYFLENPESNSMEYDLKWQALSAGKEIYYFCPSTGFKGEAEAPSAFWLSLPGEMSLGLDNLTHWDVQVARQMQKLTPEESKIHLNLKRSLRFSPSSLESYNSCAYIFLAQKVFKLQDHPILDLDVDRRTRGNLVHKLLEVIVQKNLKSISYAEVQEILSSARESSGLSHLDDFVWKSLSEKFYRLAQRFIKFEADEANKFPGKSNFAVEKDFKVYWHSAEKKFKKDQGESALMVSGRIDRIDKNQDYLAIYDYKMSPANYAHFSKWLSDNQLQLALYLLAIEDGSIEDIQNMKVAEATYYILKTMKKDKGLRLEDANLKFFELDGKKNKVSMAAKEDLKESVRELLAAIFNNIESGHFTPAPLKQEQCKECQWRNQCRAPHLI